MIKKVFIDTDVILDVALARDPFFSASKIILAMAENNIIIGAISSNCVANIYYILRKTGGNSQARKFISAIVKYITVITIDHKNVLEALKSKFSDFEDALQHYSAIEHQCEYIITRNIEDYKNAEIPVLLPEEFIRMFQ
nr:PIN domain-containing protein [uncultured Treponema sp.]